MTDTDPRLDQLRQQIAQANERIRNLAGDFLAATHESDRLAELLGDAVAECDQTRRERDQYQRSASAAWERAHELRDAYHRERASHQATVDEAAEHLAALTSQCGRLEAALVEYIDGRARDAACIVRLELERAILLDQLERVRVVACDC